MNKKQKCIYKFFFIIFNNFLYRIIERITPRFSHINPAVVFSAIKVIVKYLDYIKNPDLTKTIIKRVAPSLGIKILNLVFLFTFFIYFFSC